MQHLNFACAQLILWAESEQALVGSGSRSTMTVSLSFFASANFLVSRSSDSRRGSWQSSSVNGFRSVKKWSGSVGKLAMSLSVSNVASVRLFGPVLGRFA